MEIFEKDNWSNHKLCLSTIPLQPKNAPGLYSVLMGIYKLTVNLLFSLIISEKWSNTLPPAPAPAIDSINSHILMTEFVNYFTWLFWQVSLNSMTNQRMIRGENAVFKRHLSKDLNLSCNDEINLLVKWLNDESLKYEMD